MPSPAASPRIARLHWSSRARMALLQGYLGLLGAAVLMRIIDVFAG
jgi:hypothetical protein